MWTRALNARSEASLSEASLSEASSSAGLRNSFSNSFSISFSIIRSAPWLRSEHFRRQEASERAFSSIFRRQEASERAFPSIFRRQEASERAFSNVFRRLEASERAFSSIFDVWRLRSEHFRAFSKSGGSGARIFEVSRGEQLRPRLRSPHGANRSLRNFRIDTCPGAHNLESKFP